MFKKYVLFFLLTQGRMMAEDYQVASSASEASDWLATMPISGFGGVYNDHWISLVGDELGLHGGVSLFSSKNPALKVGVTSSYVGVRASILDFLGTVSRFSKLKSSELEKLASTFEIFIIVPIYNGVLLRGSVSLDFQNFLISLSHEEFSFLDGNVSVELGGMYQNERKMDKNELVGKLCSAVYDFTVKDKARDLSNYPIGKTMLLHGVHNINHPCQILFWALSGMGKTTTAEVMEHELKKNGLNVHRLPLGAMVPDGFKTSQDYLGPTIAKMLDEAESYDQACKSVFFVSEVVKTFMDTNTNDDMRNQLGVNLLALFDGTMPELAWRGRKIERKDFAFKFYFDDSCSNFCSKEELLGIKRRLISSVQKRLNGDAPQDLKAIVSLLYAHYERSDLWRLFRNVLVKNKLVDEGNELLAACFDGEFIRRRLNAGGRHLDFLRRFKIHACDSVAIDLEYMFELHCRDSRSPTQDRIDLVRSFRDNDFANISEIVNLARDNKSGSHILGSHFDDAGVNFKNCKNREGVKQFLTDKVLNNQWLKFVRTFDTLNIIADFLLDNTNNVAIDEDIKAAILENYAEFFDGLTDESFKCLDSAKGTGVYKLIIFLFDARKTDRQNKHDAANAKIVALPEGDDKTFLTDLIGKVQRLPVHVTKYVQYETYKSKVVREGGAYDPGFVKGWDVSEQAIEEFKAANEKLVWLRGTLEDKSKNLEEKINDEADRFRQSLGKKQVSANKKLKDLREKKAAVDEVLMAIEDVSVLSRLNPTFDVDFLDIAIASKKDKKEVQEEVLEEVQKRVHRKWLWPRRKLRIPGFGVSGI